MTAVLDKPTDLRDMQFLGEDEVCHLGVGVLGQGSATACGAPKNCPHEGNATIWTSETTCTDCGRMICPECLAIAKGGDQ